MIDADISRRLSGISKEQLFENFSTQLGEMQAQQNALQSELSARDAAIAQLRQQVSALQQKSQMDQTVSDRLIQSARHEAQGIINDANTKAQAIIQQAQGTTDDANRQAQAIIQQAQAKASEISNTQTRLLKSQIATLRQQKQQAAAEAERCLKGILDTCDAFTDSTSGYESDLQTLRDSAASAIESIQTERFVQSSIGDNASAGVQQSMPQSVPNVTASTPAPLAADDDDDADQVDDIFTQSPIDALLNANSQQDVDAASNLDADVTTKMLQRKPQGQIVIPAADDEPDDDFVFDPNDTISPDDAKSFTSEFNFGDLVRGDDDDAHQTAQPQPHADDDDEYQDGDYDMETDGAMDVPTGKPAAGQNPKPRQRKQTQSKGQWF